MTKKLDYIAGMGFDAIWITPVVDNTPGGYHGYWMRDLTKLNSNFGTEQDLKTLVDTAHSMGIWVMVDVVQNHMGPDPNGVTGAGFNPFNQTSYYHDCSGCPSNCNIQDWNNRAEVEHCRLAGLPDLDQSQSFVSNALLEYATSLVNTYGFDGIRADTVPEINDGFWNNFQKAVGVYTVGEVFNGDVSYVSAFQGAALDGVLSYPLFFTMRSVFAQGQSMNQLQSMLQSYSAFPNQDLLGTFNDNHDNPRMLSVSSDTWRFKNEIVFTLATRGIPIIYYGSEQGFHGGNDPDNREPLWPTGFDTTSDLYVFIQTVVQYRKKAQIWTKPQVQRYSDDTYYAFTRGDSFFSFTNVGANGGDVDRTITYHPYADGTKLCNLFYPVKDCVTVVGGKFDVHHEHGEVKIYYPSS